MKTFEQLQKEYGESTCGRSTELYIYQYFQAEMHEYGKHLQGTILDLEFDLNRAKERVKDWELECDSLHEQLNALKDDLHNSETENDKLSIQYDVELEAYEIDRINLVSMTIRKDQLEEWLTEYRDQLKKENVYHKNTGIINAINELFDESSADSQ